MRFRPFRALVRDRKGVTALEFALVAPVMMMMIMGLGEVLAEFYFQSVLTGAVQKAGRDSGIEGGGDITSTIDGKVLTAISAFLKGPTQNCNANPPAGTYCSTRRSYDTFSAVGPEPFVDANGDGIRQTGECYTDINGNKKWDADPGSTGQGGAEAVTLYTMTVTYGRFFPVGTWLGLGNTETIKATTLLKNQPYATQVTSTVSTVCT